MIQNTCKTCVHWAPILRQNFLGICGVSKQCTDRVDTCASFEARPGEDPVVKRENIDEYLE